MSSSTEGPNRKGRKKAPENTPVKPSAQMSAPEFINFVAEQQMQVLQNMAQAVLNGDLFVADDADADAHIELIVSEWCEQDEPTIDLHMHVLGAIFLWALLDQLYEHETGIQPTVATARSKTIAGVSKNGAPSAGQVTIEVLKTARAIWGK
jgi:hypothetical protein